ncbi:MAG: hypothetical protein Q9219_004359 [cf. Caloplaca sp. 3 TL-2023]
MFTWTYSITVLLLICPFPSLQVDIKLHWYHNPLRVLVDRDPVSAICTGILPGVCCQAHENVILPPGETLYDYLVSQVSFTGLQFSQFGAGWRASNPRYSGIGCTGRPLVLVYGPTVGEVTETRPDGLLPAPDNMVFAASWTNLRVKLPPDDATSKYLMLEGVKDMAWGKDSWAVSAVKFPMHRKRQRQKPKLNDFAIQGQAVIETPSRWRYPDVYELNGTEYRNSGDDVFRSESGRILNVTSGKVE